MNTELRITAFLSALLLVVAGCQQEEYEMMGDDEENALSRDSEAYDLMYRSAMYDGSQDDQIDGSPCFSIQFPFTLVIDEEEVEIDSTGDLDLDLDLEDLLENMALKFPVTLKTSSYEFIEVKSRQEFIGMQQACRNLMAIGGAPLRCAQLKFPLEMLVYNTQVQETSSITVSNKNQLFNYLKNLSSSDLFSLDYPVEVIYRGRSGVEVSSNGELIRALKDCSE